MDWSTRYVWHFACHLSVAAGCLTCIWYEFMGWPGLAWPLALSSASECVIFVLDASNNTIHRYWLNCVGTDLYNIHTYRVMSLITYVIGQNEWVI